MGDACSMRWLIVGGGGVGGYYASRLAQAGESVTLVSRGAHLEAINRKGLRLNWERGTITTEIPAFDLQGIMTQRSSTDFDLLVLTVKSSDTADILSQLSQWLSNSQIPVLSLQNGVDNEARIAEVVGQERTLGGLVVKLGGHIVEPGVITAEGEARIIYGMWPEFNASNQQYLNAVTDALKSVFVRAEIDTTQSNMIRRELWRKLLINNGVNPLSALTGLDTRSITRDPELRKIVIGMMQEVVIASQVDDVNLDDSDLSEMLNLITNFNAIKTSMLVDVEKRRPLELDSICGAVVTRCRKLAHEPHYTATVMALLKNKIRKLE